MPNTKKFYYRVKKIQVLKHKIDGIPSNSICQRNLLSNFLTYFWNIKEKIYISLETKHDIHDFCFD